MSLGASQSSHSRTVWSPEHSTAVEVVLSNLTERYRSGALKEELRPTTLMDLGGEFTKFYAAAFRRVDRPVWAQQRFPNGFSDLVTEINQRLSSAGIAIVNSIQSPALYRRIPQEPRRVIENLKEMITSGLITKEEALLVLSRDHGITLKQHQITYHFGSDSATRGVQSVSTIDERKRTLASTIERIKKELSLELSIDTFLKGNLFEAFVGVCLPLAYPEVVVKRQAQYPIAYKDFDGNPHVQVFADFVVEGEIFEAKLRNSYEDICRSALAQLCAYERANGERGHITVVYRYPCPLMRLAIDSNMTFDSEAEALELVELGALGRRINKQLSYIPITDLIERTHTNQTVLTRLLATVDATCENGSISDLKQLTHWLTRIGKSGNQIPERCALLLSRLEAQLTFSAAEEKRLFGDPATSEEETNGSALRLRLIERSIASARERLLAELYTELCGTSIARLGEIEVAYIESVLRDTPAKFESAVINILGRKELQALERVQRRRTAAEERSADNAAILPAFARVQERLKLDLIQEAKLAYRDYETATSSLISRITELMAQRRSISGISQHDQHLQFEAAALRRFNAFLQRTIQPETAIKVSARALARGAGQTLVRKDESSIPRRHQSIARIEVIATQIAEEAHAIELIVAQEFPKLLEQVSDRANRREPGSGEQVYGLGKALVHSFTSIETNLQRIATEAAQSPEVKAYLSFLRDEITTLRGDTTLHRRYLLQCEQLFAATHALLLTASYRIIGGLMDSSVQRERSFGVGEVIGELLSIYRLRNYSQLELVDLTICAGQAVLQIGENILAATIRAETIAGRVLTMLRAQTAGTELIESILLPDAPFLQAHYRHPLSYLIVGEAAKSVSLDVPTRAVMKAALESNRSLENPSSNREQFLASLHVYRETLLHFRKALMRRHEIVFTNLFSGTVSQAISKLRTARPGDRITIQGNWNSLLTYDAVELLKKNNGVVTELFSALGLLPQHLYLDILARREAQARVLAYHDFSMARDFLLRAPLLEPDITYSDAELISTALERAKESDTLYERLLQIEA